MLRKSANPLRWKLTVVGGLAIMTTAFQNCAQQSFSAKENHFLKATSVFGTGDGTPPTGNSADGGVLGAPGNTADGSAPGSPRRRGDSDDGEFPDFPANPGDGTIPGTPSVPRPPPRKCSDANKDAIQALVRAVQKAGLPGKDVIFGGYLGATSCQAWLAGFSSTTKSTDGTSVSNPIRTADEAQLGVNCTTADGNPSLLLASFYWARFITDNSESVSLCQPTTPAPCVPSSGGFILEIQFSPVFHEVTRVVLPDGKTVESEDLACNDGVVLASPLVIEDTPGAGIRTLDPLATQTYFDITGSGRKDRISCVRDGAFLALPDKNGEVLSVNQLFGDNTIGPDGKGAANGFVALGKHDLNGDGVVDTKDPVFNSLRLWRDSNCDAIAQADEVKPLASDGIAAILVATYLPMHEVDPWGNVTAQRSLVRISGAQPKRVFDLWFRIAK